jgi:hypothetical protein
MNPAWTWEEINTDWLLGNQLALPAGEVVAAFNRADRVLGREWIAASRIHSGFPVRGTSPTLHVVTTGQMLASLEGASGTDELIKKLRSGDASAFAELTAVHLIRSGEPDATIELGPIAQVGERNRKPDFRIRQGGESWIYVEVTQPDVAEAQNRVLAIMERLAALLQPIKKGFALEVFLRREPTDNELNTLAGLVPHFCLLEGDQSKDLVELAILTLNASAPGQVVPHDHPGEPNIPRLGFAKVVYGPDEPHRHIAVRMAYADDRAEDFLKKEARQLPNHSPGLVMVQMSRAPGGIKSWEPILRRRFQPNLHTRVSAVCLIQSGLETTPDGEAWIPEVKVISNPHARIPLPKWITDGLSRITPTRYP